MKKVFITLALLLTLSAVTPVHAALDYSGLVQCDGVIDPLEDGRKNTCDFADLINMTNYIIRWVFGLTIPIFIFLLAYAGFLYMTPSPGNRGKANKMLWAAVTGFVIMLCAWFIVSTLLKWLISKEFKGADAFIEQQR